MSDPLDSQVKLKDDGSVSTNGRVWVVWNVPAGRCASGTVVKRLCADSGLAGWRRLVQSIQAKVPLSSFYASLSLLLENIRLT
jgi:hypothetical protein